jgi:hypothetical protein
MNTKKNACCIPRVSLPGRTDIKDELLELNAFKAGYGTGFFRSAPAATRKANMQKE